jgi:hypothetical protein
LRQISRIPSARIGLLSIIPRNSGRLKKQATFFAPVRK